MPFVLPVELHCLSSAALVHLYIKIQQFVCVARPASVSEVRDSREGNIIQMSN